MKIPNLFLLTNQRKVHAANSTDTTLPILIYSFVKKSGEYRTELPEKRTTTNMRNTI